ncbi:hypothetical protein MMA231_02471 [Asticcacaulis sp. MM231]|uniref:GPO family capsid scaffolding protein n=1 Tax=Asticcacaulis sp. MM231 TaxID=3157666 RepID=UPI0032D57ED0
MAKKTKFVRIATSGNTIDGRKIDPTMLKQAAKNFNRETYPARINLEHFKGITGQPPFQSYGDIVTMKTEDVTLQVGGKDEKRVGLYAELEVSDDLIALNKNGQKLYTSIELYPNFAESNEAYIGGLAITDSPASLGTERLEFTARAKAFGAFVSEPEEFSLDLEPSAVATTEAESFMTGLKNFITGLAAPKIETPPAPVVTPDTPPADMAAFAAVMQQGFSQLTGVLEAQTKATDAKIDKITSEFTAFKAEVEKTPVSKYTPRPVSSGGDGVIMADC